MITFKSPAQIPLLLIGLALSLLSLNVLAESDIPAVVVEINENFKSTTVGQGIEYWVADSAEPEPREVLAREGWNRYQQDSLSFGFSPEPHWIRFRLVNSAKTPREILLEIANPYLDYIDVYEYSTTGEQLNHSILGDQFPAKERSILHSNFLAAIEFAANENKDILIRVQTRSTNRVPLELWDAQHYIVADYYRTVIQSLLYGALFAIAIYHLMLFFSVKEKAYLYFSISALGMLCVVLSLDGVATALLWPTFTKMGDYFILLGMTGTIIATGLFSQSVLNLQEHRRLNQAMTASCIAASVLSVLCFVLQYQLALKIALVLALIHAILQIVVYFARLLQGYEPAKYVATAIILGATGIIITILATTGRIPSHPLSLNAVAIGTVLAVLFYSFALSNRMNLDRALREAAQLQLTQDLDFKVRERSKELEHANEKLLHASITDGLTGLMNRRRFDEVLNTEFRRAFRQKHPLAVLMMDIDYFKKLNDNYGHQFGDLCLKEVATRIGQCLNRPPDICARYGGEEFVILLPNTPLEGAVNVAKSINKQVAAAPIDNAEHTVTVTISIGVAACIPESIEASEALMKAADDSLYKAKEEGRNRVAYVD